MVESTINFDKYGHCIRCHENLIIEQVIDGKLQTRLSPKYDETNYLLDDGSKMRVVTCKLCKPDVTEEMNEEIMACVIKGWEVETDLLVKDKGKPAWTKEKKKEYMEVYSKKGIVTIADGKDEGHLKKALRKYKEKKNKGKKNGDN